MKNYLIKYFDLFKFKIRLKTAIISQVNISVFGVSNQSPKCCVPTFILKLHNINLYFINNSEPLR